MRHICWIGGGVGILLGLGFYLTGPSVTSPPPPSKKANSEPWFSDVTEEVGLNFMHDAGTTEDYFLPQIMGSGAALLDFDNDGRLDIYLVQNAGPHSRSTNQLFHQEANGRYRDVSAGSGLEVAGWGMGVAVGDVNNDGWPDVLLTEYGRIRLFINNGNSKFKDVSKEADLDGTLWGTSACFFDYDRDGWLDLVVVNYVDYDPQKRCSDQGGKRDYCSPKSFTAAGTRLFHNLGRAIGTAVSPVRFADVTTRSGLARVKGPGLGVCCADFTGDRWPDILVANDGWPNYLWVNQKDGTFKEEAVVRGIAYDALGRQVANMGMAVGDVDGNGLLDVYITHLPEELHNCWKQGPPGYFRDKTAGLGLANPRWRSTGFGTVLADFDHDGALDIAVVNGAVRRTPAASRAIAEVGSFWDEYAERNQLFANEGTGRFRDISAANDPFCGQPTVARGLACGDLCGDGTLSLLVNRIAAPARLYRCTAAKRGHWLLVRVVDPALGGRDAYGAEVTVQAKGRRWQRWLNPGYSYLCSNDPRAHFGLEKADYVEGIQVLWPDGAEEAFPGRAVDQVVVLRKGEGQPVPVPRD